MTIILHFRKAWLGCLLMHCIQIKAIYLCLQGPSGEQGPRGEAGAKGDKVQDNTMCQKNSLLVHDCCRIDGFI